MSKLEDKFDRQVHQSKVDNIAKGKKIEILLIAKNRLESEVKNLKSGNADQNVRINQLEEIILREKNTKIPPKISNKVMVAGKSVIGFIDQKASTSSAIYSNVNLLPSSCKDLSTKGHTSNGIYLLYDSNVKKVPTSFCDFNNIKKGI